MPPRAPCLSAAPSRPNQGRFPAGLSSNRAAFPRRQLVDVLGGLPAPCGGGGGAAHSALHAAVEGLQALAHAPAKCLLAAQAGEADGAARLLTAAQTDGNPPVCD